MVFITTNHEIIIMASIQWNTLHRNLETKPLWMWKHDSRRHRHCAEASGYVNDEKVFCIMTEELSFEAVTYDFMSHDDFVHFDVLKTILEEWVHEEVFDDIKDSFMSFIAEQKLSIDFNKVTWYVNLNVSNKVVALIPMGKKYMIAISTPF